MALTGIQAYPIAHGKNNTGGGGTTVINNNGGGGISSDISINSITAEQGNINTLGGIDLNYNKGTFMEMTSGEGQINNLRGENINYTSGRIAGFQSDNTQIGSLNADEISALKAYIKSLMTDEISTQYLTVTKQAHFFELIIDKVKSAGGTLLLSQAQCVADYVKAVDANGNYLNSLNDPTAKYYDVFFLAKDDKTGRDIRNDWVVNDQAYCQSFSNVSSGHSYDVKNKYYWRLVTDILPDTYMNLTTGETTSGNNNVNMVDIRAPYLTYQMGGTQGTTNYDIGIGWNITPEGDHAYWSPHPGNIQNASYGYMVTETSDVGIKLTPRAGSSLAQVIPSKFAFGCSSARLNIAVYYVDGTSQYFPAPEKDYFIEHPQTSYEVNLTTSTPISKIIITNADDVEWKFVHGIRLSNVSGGYDSNFPNNPNGEQAYMYTSSIPSKGDNIAQLGYRWRYTDPNEDESMKSRGNAIIIAAYRTPDFGTQGQQAAVGIELSSIKPPSYAQYEAIGSDSSHYFNLAYYRKTYMDANGSKFYGDFYIRAQGQQGYENMSTDVTELKVGVQGVQAQVTSGIQGVQTQIDLSTNGVQAYIINGLQSTGVDITSGKINLQADKVTFSSGSQGTQGVQSGKVWIDTNYGTLHAVNGDFSGKVTANLSYSPTTVINQIGSTIEKYNMNTKTDWTTSFKCNTQNNYIKIMLPKAGDYDGIELNFYVTHSGTYPTLIYQSSNETSGTNHIKGRPWVVLTLSGATFEAPDLGNSPFTTSSIMLGMDQLITLKSMGADWYIINGRATAGTPQAW